MWRAGNSRGRSARKRNPPDVSGDAAWVPPTDKGGTRAAKEVFIATGFALWMTFGEAQLRAADLERGEARKRPCNHTGAQDSQERHRKEDAGSDDVAEASRLRGVSEIDR